MLPRSVPLRAASQRPVVRISRIDPLGGEVSALSPEGHVVSSVRPLETGREPASLRCNCHATGETVFPTTSLPLTSLASWVPVNMPDMISVPHARGRLIAMWLPKIWNEGRLSTRVAFVILCNSFPHRDCCQSKQHGNGFTLLGDLEE